MHIREGRVGEAKWTLFLHGSGGKNACPLWIWRSSVRCCLDIWGLNHISKAIMSPWWNPAELIFVGYVIALFWLKILAEFTQILSILKIITNENCITFYLIENASFLVVQNPYFLLIHPNIHWKKARK